MNRSIFIAAGFFAFTISTAAFAAGNPDGGKVLFQGRCALCHYVDKSRGDPLGPNLDGVASRKQWAAEPGYEQYSPALKNAKLTWDDATLDKWLADPAALVPGTRMSGFRPMTDAATRADMIAYLDTLK
jgi:cytochrome c